METGRSVVVGAAAYQVVTLDTPGTDRHSLAQGKGREQRRAPYRVEYGGQPLRQDGFIPRTPEKKKSQNANTVPPGLTVSPGLPVPSSASERATVEQ